MEFTVDQTGFKWIMNSEGCWLMIRHPDREKLQEFIKALDKPQSVTIKTYRKKRSLDANAYYHVLKDEIANILRTDKDELHVELLRRYSTIKTDANGNKIILSVESKIDFGSFYKYFDTIGKSKVNGKDFTHYKILKGSSEMDTLEMSILIDGVVSEAKELDIETMPPDELARLKQEWSEKK